MDKYIKIKLKEKEILIEKLDSIENVCGKEFSYKEDDFNLLRIC